MEVPVKYTLNLKRKYIDNYHNKYDSEELDDRDVDNDDRDGGDSIAGSIP